MSFLQDNEYNEYFVPGFGISRHIIFSHIHFYLGRDASVRAYSYHGREGYLITAPGLPLTKVNFLLIDLLRLGQDTLLYGWLTP